MGRTRDKVVGVDQDNLEEKSVEIKDTKKKDKKRRFLKKARIYINANFNNTLITLTDEFGNVLVWASAGNAGLKNTKKGTPFAGTKVMELLIEKIKNFDIDEIEVITKGVGPGREPALRVLFSKNFNITKIEDKTPIPFGGPKRPRPRRV